MSDKKERSVGLIDIETVVLGNKENYARFMAKLSHLPPLLRSTSARAYETALDDMARLLDKARIDEPHIKVEPDAKP